ncbi:MAG: ornithine carbamoyltransferase [Candidatus Dormibacteraceae bacterium]
MSSAVATRHLLRVTDLREEELISLLDLAAAMKAEPAPARSSSLAGRTATCLFEKPSTRTRLSIAAAAHRLGLLPIFMDPAELQLSRGETIGDTVRAISAYSSVLVVRTFSHLRLEEMAEVAAIPIVNALSDDHHPCQALADLLTLRERFGRLPGLRVAFLGDGRGNVVHSLIEACALAGVGIKVACPDEHRPDREVLERAAAVVGRSGGGVAVVSSPEEAVAGADCVYTDVWVSMGSEGREFERIVRLAPYRVDGRLMALAAPGAIFMHCLPAHRGLEVTADVIDGPSSAVWDQAANRMPTAEAVLATLLDR